MFVDVSALTAMLTDEDEAREAAVARASDHNPTDLADGLGAVIAFAGALGLRTAEAAEAAGPSRAGGNQNGERGT
jgi:uncharacterized protein with PIN domain